MNAANVIKDLQGIVTSREELINLIKRKKWRASEKAMATANFMREIEALYFAIGAVSVIAQADHAHTVIPGTNIPDAGTPVY